MAFVGLAGTFPLLIVVALAVKLDSPGPALFRQHRIGKFGRGFTLFKFRSMMEGGDRPFIEETGQPDYMTRLGYFLRRTKLDELPQLWNVLRGDMSLVGPRPMVPKVYSGVGHTFRERAYTRPGITGLAQIRGGISISWEERCRLDIRYVETLSLGLDLAILIRTVPAVLRGPGDTTAPPRT